MIESVKRECPNCGCKHLSSDGLCPICLLKLALFPEEQSESSYAAELTETEGEPPPTGASTVFENYEVMTSDAGTPIVLGRGAMGVTYKAIDVDLRCQVALKVINERYLNDELARLRFIREARAAAQVRHPNVASIYRLGKNGESYFYAMEFVDGETVKSLIRRSGRLNERLALAITTQVATGLLAIHKKNLVHRDLKPTNIMVNVEAPGNPVAKIIDLGLAKGSDDSVADQAISMPGAFVGTPEFASPEQFRGIGVDIRSDLYSLGITLWEMLTGQTPFRGTIAEVMAQHQQAPLPLEKLANVSQPMVLLLQTLLEKDPARRFRDPADLLEAITTVEKALHSGVSLSQQSLQAFPGDLQIQASKKAPLWKWAQNLMCAGNRRFFWAILALLAAGGIVSVLTLPGAFRNRASEASGEKESPVGAPKRAIAVLPFESLTENKSDAYFADGIQDEILSKLAKVSQLRVISRTSVMSYRLQGNRDLRTIANALQVTNVVEGTVRRDGNRVRITTALIDAHKDQTIWSDSYDRDLTDIFAIQSEIAESVAKKLSAQLTPEEGQQIQERPTKDLDAFDLYLQAKELLAMATVARNEESRLRCLNAINLLQDATRKDTGFALAFCLLAKAHDLLYTDEFDNTPQRRALGDAAVNEALRLRPDLPEVHLAIALHRYVCYRDYEGSLLGLAIAGKELPNSPDVLTLKAYIDRRQGRWEQAVAGLDKAVSLDPRNSETLIQFHLTYLYLRRYPDCQRVLDQLIQLEPNNAALKVMKAGVELDWNANLSGYRTALKDFSSHTKVDLVIASRLFTGAVLARDWASAEEILNTSASDEFYLFEGWGKIPRDCVVLWLERIKGQAPLTAPGFSKARDELNLQVKANPQDQRLLSALSLIDAALGRKQEAIEEARQAVQELPVSKDAMMGPLLAENLALVYALTNETDQAFQALTVSAKTPGGATYGDLKLNPAWDSLRSSDRFDELMAQLGPHR
jgi:serine/threonine protein kinase/Flp pilus assembly protein TadD